MHKTDEDISKMETRNVMGLNLKLLQISGIIAPMEIKASSFRMTLYNLYFICCYLIYFPVLSGQVMALYHFWGDIAVTTDCIFNLLGALMCFIEATHARFNTREIAKLFETFQNQVMRKMSTVGLKEKRNTIFDSANKKARQITLTVMITLDVMVAVWIPTPFIKRLMEEHNNATNYEIEDEKKWLNFCYIIWFPSDITKSPYFEIMYLMQCIVFLIGTTYRKAIDTTVAAMMVHISAQFQILYTALEDMDAIMFLAEEKKKKYVRELRFLESRKLSGRAENVSLGGEPQYTGLGSPARNDVQEWKVCDNVVDTDIEDGGTEKDLPELTRYLANFVEYHQTVIDFASDVNKAVGPIFFVCFFVRQFLGCVTSFQIALMWGQDNSIFKFIFGLVAAMCSPMIFCWYGTAIIENSRELQKAAFECQWYKRSKAMKHFLLMITVRSQKAVYLSGCQYYVVSLQTFGKMMNTMYAYFTLLKNQYKY